MLSTLLPLLIIHCLALISPWPDFLIVVKNTLWHGRKAGTRTGLGIALGIIVHIAYCLAGVWVIIANSLVLFTIIKIAGGLYLLYIGIQSVRHADAKIDLDHQIDHNPEKTNRGYLRQWFFINVLNPKAALYFVALFTTFVPKDVSTGFLWILGVTTVILTAIRFVTVANIIGLPIVRSWFARYTKWINRVCGWLLTLFGLKLITMDK